MQPAPVHIHRRFSAPHYVTIVQSHRKSQVLNQPRTQSSLNGHRKAMIQYKVGERIRIYRNPSDLLQIEI